MTTPSSPPPAGLNPTEVRKAVIAEVIAQRVHYVTGAGIFYVDGEPITGPRRRTYAEMRTNALVEGGGAAEPLPLKLTRKGRELARDWGLISQ